MSSASTRIATAAILSSFALASVVATAPLAARADDEDPGVARIGLLQGRVAVKRADSGDTLAAAINAPLNVGDYLTTERDARTELQLDNRTVLRVAADTQLRFTTMTPTSNALQVALGTVELRLFNGNAAHPEIDTPNATVRPNDSGRYRVSVDGDGNTFVTARAGTVDVVTQSATQSLEPGTTLEIAGDGARATVQTLAAASLDGFDRWNDERDRSEADARSYAYTDPRIVGAGDLDRYGSWSDVAGYGEAWRPDYGAGWAPYHDGRWVWEPYYGWTWVSAEPWGWAPYHYGRWFYANNGWYWYPAVVAYQPPVYRPALVAFFSFGLGGGGANFGFGNLGWVPLAPYEAFRPWWGRGYANRTTVVNNVTNVTNITNYTYVTNINRYRNIRAPGGAVAVHSDNFARGDFNRVVPVSSEQLRGATAVRGVLPVVPTHQNLAYAQSAAPIAARAPAATFSRFATAKPLAPVRPFVEQQAALKAVAQRQYPAHAATSQKLETSAPEHATTKTATGITQPVLQSQQRVDHTIPASAPPTQAWRRFEGSTHAQAAPGPASVQQVEKPNTLPAGHAVTPASPSTSTLNRSVPTYSEKQPTTLAPASHVKAPRDNAPTHVDSANHVPVAAPPPHHAVDRSEGDKAAPRVQSPSEHAPPVRQRTF